MSDINLNHYKLAFIDSEMDELDVYAVGYYQNEGFFIFEVVSGIGGVVYSVNQSQVLSIELKDTVYNFKPELVNNNV